MLSDSVVTPSTAASTACASDDTRVEDEEYTMVCLRRLAEYH